jgi:Polyketide cyclase / dehydrase and lipid transport
MFTEVFHINCRTTRAFDVMADLRNETNWNSGVSQADLKTGEPIGQGSRFTIVKKDGRHDVTIAVFNRPERLLFQASDDKMDIEIGYVFVEAGGATTVTGTMDLKPKGLMAFLFPLLKPLIRRDLAKQHANFVQLCETQD